MNTPTPDSEGEKPSPESVFDPLIAVSAPKSSAWSPRGRKLLEIVSRDHPSRFALFSRVMSGNAGSARPSSKSQCIKAFCLDCMGFDSVAVRECGDSCCALWRHRPFQKKGEK